MAEPVGYVAVDSGGTHTSVMAALPGRQPITYDLDVTLSGVSSPEEYHRLLSAIFAPLTHNPLAHPVQVCIAAACHAASTRDDITRALPGLLGPGERTVAVFNDAVALLLGSEVDGVVIAGTGSQVLLQDGESLARGGGEEWVAHDEGSGFWIGLRGIRAAARGDSALLLGEFEGHHLMDIPSAYRALAEPTPGMKARIAAFAPAVFRAARGGDQEASRIVLDETAALATTLRRTAVGRTGLTVLQSGGMFQHDAYRESFEQHAGPQFQWQRESNGLNAAMHIARHLPRIMSSPLVRAHLPSVHSTADTSK